MGTMERDYLDVGGFGVEGAALGTGAALVSSGLPGETPPHARTELGPLTPALAEEHRYQTRHVIGTVVEHAGVRWATIGMWRWSGRDADGAPIAAWPRDAGLVEHARRLASDPVR